MSTQNEFHVNYHIVFREGDRNVDKIITHKVTSLERATEIIKNRSKLDKGYFLGFLLDMQKLVYDYNFNPIIDIWYKAKGEEAAIQIPLDKWREMFDPKTLLPL
jgi:hypothetical protein